MWSVMNKCQHQLVCCGLYQSSACFCYFLKQEEENKMSCMSSVGIVFRPRLIALFSSPLFLLSVYSVYNILKIVMPKKVSQSKGAKNRPKTQIFKPLRPQDAKKKWLAPTLI